MKIGFESFGEVYPRVCGGTALMSTVEERVSGLSPRVRGNPGGVCWYC